MLQKLPLLRFLANQNNKWFLLRMFNILMHAKCLLLVKRVDANRPSYSLALKYDLYIVNTIFCIVKFAILWCPFNLTKLAKPKPSQFSHIWVNEWFGQRAFLKWNLPVSQVTAVEVVVKLWKHQNHTTELTTMTRCRLTWLKITTDSTTNKIDFGFLDCWLLSSMCSKNILVNLKTWKYL